MTKKMVFLSLSLVVLTSCARETFASGTRNTKEMVSGCELSSYAPFAKKKLEREPLAPVNPVMKDNGIVIGGKAIRVTPSGKIKIITDGKELASLSFNINTKAKKWMTQLGKAFFNKKLKVDLKGKTITFTAAFPLDKQGAVGTYSHSIKLLSNGLISFNMTYALPKKFEKVVSQNIFFITIPFSYCEGKKSLIGDKVYRFATAESAKTKRPKSIYAGKPSSLSFTPSDISTCFELKDINAKALYLRENRLQNGRSGATIGIRLIPLKRKVGFMLDLRKSSAESIVQSVDCHAGVDFWKSDRLHVPDYSKCANLIQNPSFEAGLDYYAFGPLGIYQKSKYNNFYECDPNVAKFGNRSLKIHAIKGMRWPCSLGTFAIPVEKGRKYTVSCYARGDKEKGLRLSLHTISGRWTVFPKLGTCRIGEKWKRYHFSFVAPNNVITIQMTGKYTGDDASGEGTIWVDGLQMQKDELSPFLEHPVCSRLLTANADNFLAPDQAIGAKLEVYTKKPLSSGNVDVVVSDYFYRKLFKGHFKFKTDSKGVAIIALPFDKRFPKGVFVVKTSFVLDDGFKKNDYHRFSIMKDLENKHKNKNITSSMVPYFRTPRANALLARTRAIGIGASGYSQARNHEQYEKMKKYGIDQGVGCIARYRVPKSGGFQIRGNDKKRHLIRPIPKLKKVTPAFLKMIENVSCEKAKMYPWIKVWMFDGEPNQPHKYDGLSWNEIVAIHKACRDGIKRANPKNKFINGGPTNMMPRGGTEWVRKFLTSGGNKFCDGAAIHPYRTLPEDPDLDSDAAIFFAMLDANGMKGCPVYWPEGIYHCNYVLPAYGLNAHRACSTDHYRCGAFSYHMGWGERISAAYYARSWLVGLKYAGRLKIQEGWANKSLYLDEKFTPYALQKVPNTLGHLLGNADFKSDVRFAPRSRCYIFEDEKKRPVAALWSYRSKVDRGNERFPSAIVPIGDMDVEVFDLMEAPVKLEKTEKGVRLPIPSAPIFVRGRPGTLDALKSAFEKAEIEHENNIPLRITIKPEGTDKLGVTVSNLLSRDFKGKLTLKLSATSKKTLDLKLKALETKEVVVKSNIAIPFNNIAKLKLPLTLEVSDGESYSIDASFKGFAVEHRGSRRIAIDGNLNDWNGVPRIKMRNRIKASSSFKSNKQIGYPGDFDATYSMLWDEEYLYLAIAVIDDKFVRQPSVRGKFGWQNDTLQVYIDTMCDARGKTTKGFDTNDYDYDFFPEPKRNRANVYRRYAPEQQITGGTNPLLPNTFEPNIKTAFKLTKTGYIYEIAFPAKYIVPLKLEIGTIAGWCVYLNDRDDPTIKKRGMMKSALTLTPDGTGGYMNPHLYPVMLLSEKKSK